MGGRGVGEGRVPKEGVVIVKGGVARAWRGGVRWGYFSHPSTG